MRAEFFFSIFLFFYRLRIECVCAYVDMLSSGCVRKYVRTRVGVCISMYVLAWVYSKFVRTRVDVRALLDEVGGEKKGIRY